MYVKHIVRGKGVVKDFIRITTPMKAFIKKALQTFVKFSSGSIQENSTYFMMEVFETFLVFLKLTRWATLRTLV